MTELKNDRTASRMTRGLTALAAMSLAAILAWSVLTLPPYPERTRSLVFENMESSGVENPVTAVLLNFRGHDTLLEIGVLLLALVSALSVGSVTSPPSGKVPKAILQLLLRLLLPFIVLLSGYILWIGKYAPGGAFQAGAVLAGGGILYVAATDRRIRLAAGIAGPAVSAGLLAFLLVALATLIARGQFLAYPPAFAGTLILLIEAAATVSIGAILALLFIGAKPGEASPDIGRHFETPDADEKDLIK
jgi:multisubunit Na+/H+ antiporter MnhB subunit